MTDLNWLRTAACQSGARHPDTWHSHDPAEQTEARAVCWACPGRPACQTAVLAAEQGLPATARHGIYAALNGEERAALDPTTPTGPAKTLAPCGTPAAYRRHLRKDEPIDPACREANTEDGRRRHAKAAQRKAAA